MSLSINLTILSILCNKVNLPVTFRKTLLKINKFLLTIFLSLLLASCGKGTFKDIGKTDSRKISPNVNG